MYLLCFVCILYYDTLICVCSVYSLKNMYYIPTIVYIFYVNYIQLLVHGIWHLFYYLSFLLQCNK